MATTKVENHFSSRTLYIYTMVIFRKNIVFVIFIIAVSSANATLQKSADQDNETVQSNAGSPEITHESPTNQEDAIQDTIRQKISDTENDSKLINVIPKNIQDFFDTSEFPIEDRLDNPESYVESNDSFKKQFEDFQKKIPFVIARELLQAIGTTYFQASSLILKLLTLDDLRNPEDTNKLNEYMRNIDISEDEFNQHEYRDWWFRTIKQGKRLIPTCPEEKVTTIEFPTNIIRRMRMSDEQLKMPLKLEEGGFTLDEDITSPSSLLPRSNSDTKISSDNKIEAESSSLSPTTADESANKKNVPDDEIPTNLSPSSPTTADESANKKNVSDVEIPTNLAPSSPTAADKSPNTNRSLTRSKSPSSAKSKNKASQVFASVKSKLFGTTKNDEEVIKNTFKGTILIPRKPVKESEYRASNFPCEYELKPTFVKENDFYYSNADAYYAGYLVKTGEKVEQLNDNIVPVNNKSTWFHIAHLMMDKNTKDTYSVFSYTTFYESVIKMKNIPIYTDYTVNENSHADVVYYKRMYSFENQKKVFSKLFTNYREYLDPNRSLILVPQELMDQKSVPLMTHKRVATDYMNISSMWKIIKDVTWSKVENVVLKLPMVTTSSTVMFVTGTYGSLKINKSELYLDHDGEIHGIRRLKVPQAFYKVVNITYQSPNLHEFIPNWAKFFFSIVIVTHNNPFETKPKKICDKPVSCSSIGWKKVEQDNPEFGFTYCCEFTLRLAETLDIVPMYKSIMVREPDYLLDLRLLWYVETHESSYPLQPGEFQLIKEKPPQYENQTVVS